MGSSAVGSDNYHVHLAMLHEMAAGIVDDQRMGNAVIVELPGGELGALVARPRFIDIDMNRNAFFAGKIDRRRRGSVIHGGEPAGIAMGEDIHRLAWLLARGDLLDDREAMLADGAVEQHVFLGDGRGPAIGCFLSSGFRQAAQEAAHVIQGPFQIDGGGAGYVQGFPSLVEGSIAGIARHGNRHAIGSGNADERCAPDPHVADGGGDIIHGFQGDNAKLVGQPALVDDIDGQAIGVQPDGVIMVGADFHVTISFSSRVASLLTSIML